MVIWLYIIDQVKTTWQKRKYAYIEVREAQKYDETVAKFKHFEEYRVFLTKLNRLYLESFTIYQDIQRENNTPNFWNRSDRTNELFIHHVENNVKSYIATM